MSQDAFKIPYNNRLTSRKLIFSQQKTLTPIQTDQNTPHVSQLTFGKLKYNLHELTHVGVITYMS